MRDLTDINATDREILQEIGRRLRELRRRRKFTMVEVAELSGLDRTTVSRAEQGDNPTLLTLVRMLRVYERLPALETFLPDPDVSPMARLRKRQRRGDG